MSNYTQGPWLVNSSYAQDEIRSSTGALVAVVNSSKDSALLAAAPELLEALTLADCMLSGANMNRNVVEQKIRAAIAKATRVTA